MIRPRCLPILMGLWVAACFAGFPAHADEGLKPDVTQQVKDILTRNCLRCHGGDGSDEGGVNYILEVRRLIARGKVVPGKPEESSLLARVKAGEMPADDDPLPQDEVNVLERWIAAGAPDFSALAPRTFVSDSDLLHFIMQDLQEHNRADRPFFRYFTLTNLYNSGADDGLLQTYRAALSKLVNSLSWGRNIVQPKPIDPAGAILRIDLRDYGWTSATWDRIVTSYTYRIDYQSIEARAIRAATGEELPYLRGDWFVARAAIPPLYHDILGVPKTEKELETLLGIDTARNLTKQRAARAGFNGSGVSRNNRLIERHDSPHGAYWRSFDFQGNNGPKNLFAHPLGAAGGQDFEHDGGEIIFSLPNGLQGYMLVDAKGNRIDQGPIDVVSDPKRPDRKVINGLSCMSCHTGGIIPKEDQVRSTVLNNPAAFNNLPIKAILALYPKSEEFAALVKRDADRFVRALEKAGAADVKSEPVSALAQRFEESIDLTLASAETGLSKVDFLVRLEKSPKLSRALAPLQSANGVVQREVFEKNFGDVRSTFNLGREELGVSIGLRLRLVPAGDFLRGSLTSDDDSQDDERPRKLVTITRPFYMATHEVTVGQFRRFVNETQRKMGPGFAFNPQTRSFVFGTASNWENTGFEQTDDHPVVNVSWEDAVAFCDWLSRKEGAKFRLPTEAEWEYACRAGATTRWAHGDEPVGLDRFGNIADQAVKTLFQAPHAAPWRDDFPLTAPVGAFLPNSLGLFDMHGNVWEWCSDWYAADAYSSEIVDDPRGPETGKFKVVRGGSWFSEPSHARAADRSGYEPNHRNLMIGFRVVREVEDVVLASNSGG